jgi:SAM-dependent methyltransferase
MSSELYSGSYYTERHERTLPAARAVTAFVAQLLPEPVRSVIDLGCGVGTWLSVWRERGAEVQGFDGDWVPDEHLRIPAGQLVRCNLAAGVPFEGRADLAMSLECAEHLPESAASGFVATLCRAADFVLFAAAIPGQTGEGHINEQWPAWWARHFADHGFVCLDWIRPRFWNDAGIDWWYRQNTLLYVRGERLGEIRPPAAVAQPLALVHPGCLDMYAQWLVESRAAAPRRKGLGRRLLAALRGGSGS